MWLNTPRRMALLCTSLGLVLLSATITSAASVDLVDHAGVSSGWTLTIPDQFASDVTVKFVRTSGNMFFFEKNATVRSSDEPVTFTFDRTGSTAKTLVIQDENLKNATGSGWNAFRMVLSSGSVGGTPNFALTTSDSKPGLGDFSIDPFKTFQFGNNNTELLLSGGTVGADATWSPGSKSSTGLAFIANSSTASHFTFKEIALSAGGGAIAIPLPAAAWTGISTLLGLGFLGAAKRMYHRLF